jgi:hypothetical protein
LQSFSSAQPQEAAGHMRLTIISGKYDPIAATRMLTLQISPLVGAGGIEPANVGIKILERKLISKRF